MKKNNNHFEDANFTRYMNARKMAMGTIKTYQSNVHDFIKFVDNPVLCTTNDIMDWMASISNLSPSTINLKLNAVKCYYDYLVSAGQVKVNPAIGVRNVRVNSKLKPYISANDAKLMMANTRTIRDRAILAVMFTNGLRVSELTELKLADYNKMKRRGGDKMVITAKGSKQRYVYFSKETQAVIDQYLEYRKTHADNAKNLFLSFAGGPINRNNLSQTLKTIAKNAGLPYWQDVCNHAIRSACATIYNERGYSVPQIQDLLGHSSINTTRRYIKTSEQAIHNMATNGMEDIV